MIPFEWHRFKLKFRAINNPLNVVFGLLCRLHRVVTREKWTAPCILIKSHFISDEGNCESKPACFYSNQQKVLQKGNKNFHSTLKCLLESLFKTIIFSCESFCDGCKKSKKTLGHAIEQLIYIYFFYFFPF